MIRRIEIKGYRALRDVSVDLDDFQIMIGPNASGKSTFFDAINLVRDILDFGTGRAIFGDAKLHIPPRAADPRELAWMRGEGDIEIVVYAEIPASVRARFKDKWWYCCYGTTLTLVPEHKLKDEVLWLCPRNPHFVDGTLAGILPSAMGPFDFGYGMERKWRPVSVSLNAGTILDRFLRSETSEENFPTLFAPNRLGLASLSDDDAKFPATTWFKHFLMEGVQRIALNAEAMRLPSRPGSQRAFLPDGSNIPWIVKKLQDEDPETFRDWIAHLRTALPDLETVIVKEREEDRSRYLVLRYTTGLEAPSWAISEGTLRLLALTLVAYAPNAPTLTVIEEPENGIHPQALETVFQSLSGVHDRQVFCATHSPVLLSMAKKEQLLCFSKTDDGAVEIVRGNEHPRLKGWEGPLVLGDVFAAGILS